MWSRIVVTAGIYGEAVLLELAALDCLRVVDRLVYPVPDTSADTIFAALDYIPIVLEVTDSITHGVRILAEEERLAADTAATVASGVSKVGVHL